MDFTPPPPSPSPSPSNPPIQQPTPISSIPFPTQKLPIKRKAPTTPISPSSDPDDVTPNPPTPFKFHRVWSEPDEIRLLQSLINSSLSFPRDLNIFYTQFISGMSHPYSKSQLSEKLRRLRKKFRAVSSRIAKGLDVSSLSPQDYALYDLSKQLWDPNVVDNSKCRPGTPILQEPMMAILALPSVGKKPNNNGSNRNGNVDHLGNVGNLGKGGNGDLKCEIVGIARKVFGDVVEESLKEIRMRIDRERCRDLEKEIEFEKRWRDQRVEEFDVLVKRLKLIVEHGSPLVSK